MYGLVPLIIILLQLNNINPKKLKAKESGRGASQYLQVVFNNIYLKLFGSPFYCKIDEIDLIVRKLAQEYGISVLLIEHRLELLAMVASRVLVLDVGEIIAEGPPDSVFKLPAVRAAYFDVPLESLAGA
jgi:ABC-type enterochelin transport system ATPase subunit